MSRFIRGVAALAVLVLLVVGVPAALVRFVGRPWPHAIPSLDSVWRSIRAGDISDAAVIKALAVVVWIAWARLAISVLIEIAARAGHRPAPSVRLLGSAQQWAAALVAAAILVVGVGSRPALASAATGPRQISVALLQDHRFVNSTMSRSADDVAVEPSRGEVPDHAVSMPLSGDQRRPVDHVPAPPPQQTHVVQRHESFWSIAEESLGDGSRWREIVTLNNGREVAPGVVFDETANRLLPGWQLMVPDGNHVEQAPPAGRTVVVAAGDTLSGIAAHELGDASQWPRVWETNRDRVLNGRVFDDPNLILIGWELIVPDAFAPVLPAPDPIAPTPADPRPPQPPVPVAPATMPAPSVPVATAPPTTDPAQAMPLETDPAQAMPLETDPAQAMPLATVPAATVPAPSLTSSIAPAPPSLVTVPAPPSTDAVHAPVEAPLRSAALGGMGAAVLLASGVVGTVTFRRRRRLRSAVVNARLEDPSPATARVEQELRRLGGGERIARLDIALRAAAAELSALAPNVGILGAILAEDGRLDLLFDGPAPTAPAPWKVVTNHSWRLDATVGFDAIADAARRVNQPCPAIAHLGVTPIDDGHTAELFLDLEAVGLLAIGGPSAESSAILRAIAAGVAVSPMSEIAHIITCGIDIGGLGHPSSHRSDSLDAALDLAASAIGAISAMTTGSLSTFALRSRQQGGEAWEPAIVFAAGGTDPDATVGANFDANIVGLASSGGRGLAVVIDRDIDGSRWSIRPRNRHWVLEPLGLELVPIGLSERDVSRIEDLLDDAESPLQPPESRCDDHAGTNGRVHVGVASADCSPPSPAWSLMVRLLGPVEIVSTDDVMAQFERSKALELVVWLTQHRGRSTRTGARTGLWETNVRDATFANVVSDARRNLARLVTPPVGEEWIGRTLTEDLPLHPGVVTDADVLSDRMRAAHGQGDVDAIATLRPALELVRDMPFFGTSYLWPDSEGITSQLTLLVTSASAVLAGHYLAIGDICGVFWSTGQGLKVLSGHEELIALRMRAHWQQGDLAGVRHEWETYERVLNADTWSDGEPSPKLVALRRELLSMR